MVIDRRYLRYFDWFSFFLIISISCIGLSFVYSATFLQTNVFFSKQALGIISGIIIYIIFSCLDYRHLTRLGYFLYFGTIGLLIFTLIKGSIGLGAQRWINLGFIKFQPSEVTKLFLPAFIVYYLETEKSAPIYKLSNFIPILLIIGFSCLLVLKQPDLGTALIIFFTAMIMIWLAGINKKFFFSLALILIIGTPVIWKFLKPYQRQRIEVFLGGGDSKKERYQIEQSKIAIGSGGLFGKGYLQGTQNKLEFLPESRTDFIFSVVCEEWGFAGALFIIFLYIILTLRILFLVTYVNSYFSQLLALGLLTHIVLSVVINIGMVSGLMPIVGIPLPLMSYGVSNLWITYASLGWINSITMRRFI